MPGAPSLSPRVVRGDRVGGRTPRPAAFVSGNESPGAPSLSPRVMRGDKVGGLRSQSEDLYQGAPCRVPHPCRLVSFEATGWEAAHLNQPLLYQGTTSVVPKRAQNESGFSPCAQAIPRQQDDGSSHGLQPVESFRPKRPSRNVREADRTYITANWRLVLVGSPLEAAHHNAALVPRGGVGDQAIGANG